MQVHNTVCSIAKNICNVICYTYISKMLYNCILNHMLQSMFYNVTWYITVSIVVLSSLLYDITLHFFEYIIKFNMFNTRL